MIDVVISAEPLLADGERGARFWVQVDDFATPPLQVARAEIRLFREAGINKVGSTELWDVESGGNENGV